MATREPKYSNEDPVQPKINYFLKKKYNQGSSLSLSRRKMNQNLHCISFIGCSVHGTFQARILEWIAISFSRASSQPRDGACISYISYNGRQILYQLSHWGKPKSNGYYVFISICQSTTQLSRKKKKKPTNTNHAD